MRIVAQRVSHAKVLIDGETVSQIDRGLLLLVGIKNDDAPADADFLARKCLNLRVFEDQQGKLNLSVLEIKGEILAVSQFTLYGDTRKGRRPSFTEAAPPQVAQSLYRKFVEALRKSGLPVETGAFGKHMLVEIHNDGPVTLIMESQQSVSGKRNNG